LPGRNRFPSGRKPGNSLPAPSSSRIPSFPSRFPLCSRIETLISYEVVVDKTFDDINPDDYEILVLPGGAAPALVRKEPKALDIARSFFARNKPVAAICHGPQILISAGLLKGRHATCYKSVVDELKEAGALYEDMDVVVDVNLVTSRQPSDLPAFMREIMKQLEL